MSVAPVHCHCSLLAWAMDLAREASSSFLTNDPMPYWLDAFGSALNARLKREGNAKKLAVALNGKKAKNPEISA